MNDAPVKIGMKPSHPGKFIHENLRELGLNVELAAETLGDYPTRKNQKLAVRALLEKYG